MRNVFFEVVPMRRVRVVLAAFAVSLEDRKNKKGGRKYPGARFMLEMS
jgi:hypothetical protein